MKQAKLGRYIFNNGTKDELMRSSFILYKGELAIEWDTGQMKVGDGVNYYKALPYLQVGPRGEKGDPITITKTGLDSNGNTVITFNDGTTTVIKKGERGQDSDLTIEDIKNKADLDETGKVPVDQLPKIDEFPTGGASGQVLKSNGNGGVAWGDDNDTLYTHPSTHPATMITEDATHRFVTDTEKTKLDGVETGSQKNTITSVQGRTGAVIITKADLGLGSVENIGIKILTQAQYDGLSSTEKNRADILYAISG